MQQQKLYEKQKASWGLQGIVSTTTNNTLNVNAAQLLANTQ